MTTIVTEDHTQLVEPIMEGLILVGLDMAPIVEEPFPSIGPLDTSEMGGYRNSYYSQSGGNLRGYRASRRQRTSGGRGGSYRFGGSRSFGGK